MTDRLQLSDILDRLEHRRAGRGYRAQCPAHGGDNKTALAIQEGEDGKVLLHCHAHGCSYEEIVRALGLWEEGYRSTTDRKTGYTKPPKSGKLTEDEKIIMACAGREALALMLGPLPSAPTEQELIPPYGGFLEELWDVYTETGDHEAVKAKYMEMRPALAQAMPKFLRALDRRLKDRLGPPLPSVESDASSKASSPFQPYSLADLQKEEIPERHWIIDEVMPEGVHLVAGPVGIGKSYWALQLCLSVAHGTKAFSKFDVEQGEALYLSLEDDKLGMKERASVLEEDGATWPRDLYIVHEAKRLDMGLVDDLAVWLDTHQRTRVIVIDVLFNIRAPQQTKADLYAQDYAVAQALKPLAYKYHVAIILLHHCNKQINPDDPLHAVSGSTGLLAPADVKAVFMRAKGEADIKLYLRGRPIREQWLAFSYRECVWTYLGEAQAVERTKTRKAIIEALGKVNGPMTPKAIAEQSGIRGDLVRFTLRKMVSTGEVKQIARGYYTLPHTHPYEEERDEEITHSQRSQETHTSQHTHASQPDTAVSTPLRIVSDPPAIVSAVVSGEPGHSQPNTASKQDKLAVVSGVSERSREQIFPSERAAVCECECGQTLHPKHLKCFGCGRPRTEVSA